MAIHHTFFSLFWYNDHLFSFSFSFRLVYFHLPLLAFQNFGRILAPNMLELLHHFVDNHHLPQPVILFLLYLVVYLRSF
ncbi:MAG: hypothetical protein HOJ16_00260 [Candidatus Peribacter sp.]|nr:hypothetical protein [Candidatus Peribacter sp.]